MDGLEVAAQSWSMKLEWLPHDKEDKRSLLWTHRDGKNEECQAVIDLAVGPHPMYRDQHVVVKENPLTLSPSLVCPTCGKHGFLKDGKWDGDIVERPKTIASSAFRVDRIVATAVRGVWKVVIGGKAA